MSERNQSNLQSIISDMSPEKVAFLMGIMQQLYGKTMEDARPVILSANASAGKSGISFTPEEIDVLIACFSAQLSPAEQNRLTQVRQMMQLYQSRNPS